MKETYYFSHDSNARNDEKILMLRAEHGWQGYGLFWALVEMMFETKATCLCHSKVKGIAISYNIDITLLDSVINTCVTEGLFVSDGTVFWSETLRQRKQKFLELRQQKSDAGRKGMAKRWGSDNAVITENNAVITENNKVKESKEKESKGKEKNKEPLSPKFADDGQEVTLSKLLFSLMKQNDPKAREPSFQKWAEHMDKLMRLDNREPEEIRQVILFCQADSFWRGNILSTKKLRDKFPTLLMRMKENKNAGNRGDNQFFNAENGAGAGKAVSRRTEQDYRSGRGGDFFEN